MHQATGLSLPSDVSHGSWHVSNGGGGLKKYSVLSVHLFVQTLQPLSFGRHLLLAALSVCTFMLSPLQAQMASGSTHFADTNPLPPPVMDNQVFAHVLFDEFEARTNSVNTQFRWDGEGWIGTDFNRFWVKSEGFVDASKISDGDHEFLYDRPIPRMRYFDAQVGVRADLDSDPSRVWVAIGVEGLAPYSFELAPTLYVRNDGRIAGRVEGVYSLRITQRLAAEPRAELNFYSKDDPARQIGSGLSDLDGGLRLRYEITRKVAPYIGYAYNGSYGNSATYRRISGESNHQSSFVFGMRIWH
jgi:copper resistance protein B